MAAVTSGDLILYWRTARGLSQQDVADMIGVTVPAVSQWENGWTSPLEAHVLAFTQGLGLTRSRFYGAEKKVGK